ncbi:MAG: AAA family ATPase [Proteobacteria bacterium]|nr:AAA family ATPase [Pseudomonadota bacterium]
MLHTLAVSNYRSLRELAVPLGNLTVVTGANGVGKSSLYRCLRLLSDTANGQLVASLAREGGMPSTLWAGPEKISAGMRQSGRAQGTVRKHPVRLRLGFTSDDFGYAIELGLPPPGASAFSLDPEIKRESIWAGEKLTRHSLLTDRKRNIVQISSDEGAWSDLTTNLPMFESVLTRVADPERAPEVLTLRDRIRSWRFYDHMRADREAPARRPQVGTWTPVLAHDGSDLAACIATIETTDARDPFHAAIADAFPGTEVEVLGETLMQAVVHQPGMLRPLKSAELSEGTLRYLMWAAALSSPYPPELMVLNEPEASLHRDLLPALGRLILRASRQSQIWVVTHSTELAAVLSDAQRAEHHVLTKEMGETKIVGQDLLSTPAWTWPAR